MDIQKLRKEFAIRAANFRDAFIDSTPSKVSLDTFSEGVAKELDEKQVVLDTMFALFDEQGIGMIYKSSHQQYGFVLPDASEEGAFRYQLFDAKGFFAHSTFSTAEEALVELCCNGYTELAPADTLEKFAATREWKLSMEKLALRTAVQDGKYTWQEAERRYALLESKYDPDLWVA